MRVICSLDAGAFAARTGRQSTWGISPYREGKELNLRFDNSKKRWFFDINGSTFSAKQINPRVTDIQVWTDY